MPRFDALKLKALERRQHIRQERFIPRNRLSIKRGVDGGLVGEKGGAASLIGSL